MLVFYKNWQGIGESPVRNEFHHKTDIPDRGFADTLSVFVKHQRSNPILMSTTPCLSLKHENCCCYGRASRLWTLKTPEFMALKCWRHDVTMSSENSQGYLWIPCKFYSSLANQIMCNKQSALEKKFTSPNKMSINEFNILSVRMKFCQSKPFELKVFNITKYRFNQVFNFGLML